MSLDPREARTPRACSRNMTRCRLSVVMEAIFPRRHPMSTQAICTIGDVDPVTRELLERLFGRELPPEQKVLRSTPGC